MLAAGLGGYETPVFFFKTQTPNPMIDILLPKKKIRWIDINMI